MKDLNTIKVYATRPDKYADDGYLATYVSGREINEVVEDIKSNYPRRSLKLLVNGEDYCNIMISGRIVFKNEISESIKVNTRP